MIHYSGHAILHVNSSRPLLEPLALPIVLQVIPLDKPRLFHPGIYPFSTQALHIASYEAEKSSAQG